MHDPVGLLTVGGAAAIEDQCLAHANLLVAVTDALVTAGCLPKPGVGGAVGARSGRVLAVLVAEEVPLILRGGSYPASICISQLELNLIRFHKNQILCQFTKALHTISFEKR